MRINGLTGPVDLKVKYVIIFVCCISITMVTSDSCWGSVASQNSFVREGNPQAQPLW